MTISTAAVSLVFGTSQATIEKASKKGLWRYSHGRLARSEVFPRAVDRTSSVSGQLRREGWGRIGERADRSITTYEVVNQDGLRPPELRPPNVTSAVES